MKIQPSTALDMQGIPIRNLISIGALVPISGITYGGLCIQAKPRFSKFDVKQALEGLLALDIVHREGNSFFLNLDHYMLWNEYHYRFSYITLSKSDNDREFLITLGATMDDVPDYSDVIIDGYPSESEIDEMNDFYENEK